MRARVVPPRPLSSRPGEVLRPRRARLTWVADLEGERFERVPFGAGRRVGEGLLGPCVLHQRVRVFPRLAPQNDPRLFALSRAIERQRQRVGGDRLERVLSISPGLAQHGDRLVEPRRPAPFGQ